MLFVILPLFFWYCFLKRRLSSTSL